MKKHLQRWLSSATGFALAVCLVPVAVAQSLEIPDVGTTHVAQDKGPTDDWNYKLGIGVGIAPDYEGGDDYQGIPIPYARAQKGHQFGQLFGLHATSNFIKHSNWRLGPSFNFRSGYSDVDNNRVDRLQNRGSSFELGIKGGYQFELASDAFLDTELEILRDISGGHEGWLFSPSATYSRALSDRWNLLLGASTTYASGSYMSHYFSVNREETIRTGLDNFDADRDLKDVEIHLMFGWEMTDRWNVNFIGQYKRMLGDAKDSPVVDDEGDENQGFSGVLFVYDL